MFFGLFPHSAKASLRKLWVLLLLVVGAGSACEKTAPAQPCHADVDCPLAQICDNGACVTLFDAGAGVSGGGSAGEGSGASGGSGGAGASGTAGEGAVSGDGGVSGASGGAGEGASSGEAGNGGTGAGSGGLGGSAGSAGVGGAAGSGVSDGRDLIISQGPGVLVDAYPSKAGILVVLQEGVRLIDRAGNILGQWPAPAPLVTAAFDGIRLVAADATNLHVLSPTLVPLVSGALTPPCNAAILLSGDRFVCDNGGFDLEVYDATTASHLGTASGVRAPGYNTKRRIPGRQHFIIADSSTHYLVSEGSGASIARADDTTLYRGFAAGSVWAFQGVPATHLITHLGEIIGLRFDACGDELNVPCFVKEAQLGTFTGDQDFVGMANDAEGRLYTMVTFVDPFFKGVCSGGCFLQLIDVAQRKVMSQKLYAGVIGAVVAFAYDLESDMVLLAHHVPPPSGGDVTDHIVRLRDYR